MGLRVFNTLGRRKEEFKPLNPPQVLMYNCGPTVYDYFHIGNARNFVFADLVRRYLEYRGYQVNFVQNFTDVDDKIIRRAQEEGVSPEEVAEKYTRIYFEDVQQLGVRAAGAHPRATEHIPQMQKLIERLLEKGHAYVVDGDVYFRVRSFKGYGALSGKPLDELKKGARVEIDERKEDPMDFALWKKAKPGEPSWESPWGKGRPGWHIECSTMSVAHLADTIDIHSGGQDLIFPHHENERAQSEAATGKPFVRYWLHNGILNIDRQKMAKSLGNYLTLRQVLTRYSAGAVRWFLLSAQYRHPLDYSEENLQQAERAVERISDCVAETKSFLEMLGEREASLLTSEQAPESHPLRKAFEEAMDDDFNSAGGEGVIFQLVNELNQRRLRLIEAQKSEGGVGQKAARELAQLHLLLGELLAVVGVELPGKGAELRSKEEELVQLLIEVREELREAKAWELADRIRTRLLELGIQLQDLPGGTLRRGE